MIIVMADGTTTVQALANVLVVRTNTDGTELFSDVRLSSGFE